MPQGRRVILRRLLRIGVPITAGAIGGVTVATALHCHAHGRHPGYDKAHGTPAPRLLPRAVYRNLPPDTEKGLLGYILVKVYRIHKQLLAALFAGQWK